MKLQIACVVAALLGGMVASMSCSTTSDCSSEWDGTVCKPDGECGCNANADCTNYYKVCDTSGNGRCHGCLTNADCSNTYAPTCAESFETKSCTSACTTDSECQTGDDKNYKCKDESCQHGMSGCEWTQKNTDDMTAKLIAGNIVGIVLGIIITIVVSLPLCCGIAKDAKAGNCEVPKIIAGVAIGVGIFIMFIPLIGTSSATEGAINDLCASSDDCDCTDKNKEDFRALLGTISFFIAYVYAFGWVAVVLGVLAACLACCVCCKCCGPLKDQAAAGGGAVPGAVIGQPVDNSGGK